MLGSCLWFWPEFDNAEGCVDLRVELTPALPPKLPAFPAFPARTCLAVCHCQADAGLPGSSALLVTAS